MEFVNKLTAKQIKEFIEPALNIKVKKIVLKGLNTSRAGCHVKTIHKAEFYFSFSDFRFDFPYVKFGAYDKSSEIRKQWFSYLIKLFGKEYADKLHKNIEHSIELANQLAVSKIRIIKEQSKSKQNSLTTAIKNTKEQEQTDIEKVQQELQQELQTLKELQTSAAQEMER